MSACQTLQRSNSTINLVLLAIRTRKITAAWAAEASTVVEVASAWRTILLIYSILFSKSLAARVTSPLTPSRLKINHRFHP